MASLDFSGSDIANDTKTGSAGTSHTLTPNGKSAALYYRDAVGGVFKHADGQDVPYDADTWTRVWGKPSDSRLITAGTIVVTPASSATPYARQE